MADKDQDRTRLNAAALQSHQLDAIVCSSPENVLLATGYWPVLGTAVAVVTRDGASVAIAPEDEHVFAADSRAERVYAFQAASLSWIRPIAEIVGEQLRRALEDLKLIGSRRRVGYAAGPVVDGSGYAARFTWGAALIRILTTLLPEADLIDATGILSELRSVLTPAELATLRTGCSTAAQAFQDTARQLHPGLAESEVAADLRKRLGATRESDGFAYCMSGPNSAHAWAAFQRSTERKLQEGDWVLMHCNSWRQGLWTDITRTFCLGEPERKGKELFAAISEARDQAAAVVRPGATACSVDAAARTAMAKHGFGEAFRHGTGHGVGYSAIDHGAIPRIHPASPDILRQGMVFNIEPAAYFEGSGGMRHCDMVVVTETGAELLTPFQTRITELVIASFPNE